jgi:NTP pyrophosphatase (non-canonical NTP hydrolase)
MHSELSEALEGARHGNPPDEHCPKHGSVAVELADCVIRIMDFAEGFGIDVAGALLDKVEFNLGRPYKHGKEF